MKRHKVHNFAAGLELLARARPAFYLKLLSASSVPSAVKSVASELAHSQVEAAAD